MHATARVRSFDPLSPSLGDDSGQLSNELEPHQAVYVADWTFRLRQLV